MKYYPFILAAFILCAMSCTDEVKLITLDPGHFHAALVQKTSYPQVSNEVYVYAPAGNEVEDHLKKIDEYNARTDNPTHWNEIVYTGADFLERMLAEKKGNVLVTAGNNARKTEYIERAITGGLNVLADKPMAIHTEGFEKLKACFDLAASQGLLLYDIMTERYEITTILQKELSRIPAVYGEQLTGSPDDPAVVKESVHHFLKTVSGSPLIRPAWFFDVEQEGAGIVDVATHLVDLVQWELFPEQVIDYQSDIDLLDANHWSTSLTMEQFKEVTGYDSYPAYLQSALTGGDTLNVFSNGDITYKIKGIHAKVSVVWNYSYPEGGGDTHFSVMKGSLANLLIRQGAEQGYKPALFVEATETAGDPEVYAEALQQAITGLAGTYPGLSLSRSDTNTWEINIPDTYRNGHEAHFGQVMEHFLDYLKAGALPAWEVPGMIAKYYVTTHALQLAKAK
ncbi:MAG: oxidoreductase [Tannerellaceae bacterium]|nr:oxidoreductase [Tannerellaceae bacterium]